MDHGAPQHPGVKGVLQDGLRPLPLDCHPLPLMVIAHLPYPCLFRVLVFLVLLWTLLACLLQSHGIVFLHFTSSQWHRSCSLIACGLSWLDRDCTLLWVLPVCVCLVRGRDCSIARYFHVIPPYEKEADVSQGPACSIKSSA